MDTLAVIMISALIFWEVVLLMEIAYDARALKYEQREIHQLLAYYLQKREVEIEKKKEANKKTKMDEEWYAMMESIYAAERRKKENERTIDR